MTQPGGAEEFEDFEQFDEDNLRLDPLEEGMDPPEHWAQADRWGNTEREVREGQDLDHRLAEEEPEPTPEPPDRPLAATPDDELDASIDEQSDDVDAVAPEEPSRPVPDRAARSGVSADEAGGSIAEEIRTPPHDPA